MRDAEKNAYADPNTMIRVANSKSCLSGRVRKKLERKRSENACAYIGVTPFVVMQLVELGRVRLTRPRDGGRPYFAKEDLDAYLSSREA